MIPGSAKVLILALTVLASGCSDSNQPLPQPKEPGAAAVGFFCRMNLSEHGGPKGQILLKGWSDPLWFSSVRDALTYVSQDLVSDNEFAGFWVNDMEQGTWDKPAQGSWISAKTAWYVLGSSKSSGMGGGEAVPFRRRDAADTFAARFGGHVASYRAARDAMSEPLPSGTSVDVPEESGT